LLIELFSLNATVEALRANIDWKSAISLQRGQFDPKFQVEGVAPTNHSYCHKTKVNGLLCGIRMRAQLSFVLSQITCLTDRQTDRQTDRNLIAGITPATRKLHGSVFYRAGVNPDWSFYIAGIGIFDLSALVTLNLTRWPLYTNLARIPSIYTGSENMNFLPHGFRNLSSDRHTDATEIIYVSRVVRYNQIRGTHELMKFVKSVIPKFHQRSCDKLNSVTELFSRHARWLKFWATVQSQRTWLAFKIILFL